LYGDIWEMTQNNEEAGEQPASSLFCSINHSFIQHWHIFFQELFLFVEIINI